jgi:2-isopropylmalate synthase
VRARTSVPLGIHVHNDAGCAVANSLVAVDAGAFQVQGTVNGYGERTGNADLIPIAADLVLKMGATGALPDGAVEHLTELARYVAEVANVTPDSHQPYAGRFAFTHKAGLHTSGVARLTQAYEHVEPEVVGNRRGVVASDYAGGSTIRMKADELGVEVADDAIPALVDELKRLESLGYAFDVAEASLELLMRRASGWSQPFFRIDSYRVHVERRTGDEEPLAEATVKVVAEGGRHIESAEGHGPVGALDNALRKALTNAYPELEHMSLEDYRVRVLGEHGGTGAVVRVLIDTSNGARDWTTVGVSENILDASWEALVDAYTYGLLHPRAATQG